jgi:tetratricopeptide (TPR) repeat protein
LEYAPLMADIYWTRAVQYYGKKEQRTKKELDSLWPLLDVATTLDPNLIPAYRFGSTFLSEKRPVGAGRPDLAVELLKRGIKQNPGYWRLYQDLGNVYYFIQQDYQRSSEAFLEGSKDPMAPPWMKIMAARILERGDTRQTSRFLWSELYQSSQDRTIKENARIHLLLLNADDDLEQINAMLSEYLKRTGKPAERIRDLVQAGLLRGEPADPNGYPYVIGKSGQAELNPQSPLFQQQTIYRRPI